MTASPFVVVADSMESNPGARRIGSRRTWQMIGALLAAVIIVSVGILVGVSQYASVRLALLQDATVRSTRFETVFQEGSEARLQALRLAAEIIARDEPLLDALRRRDRTDLARRSVPLFEQVLKPRFSVTVCDFPGIDGTMFFRAHRPDLFGDSVAERAMVTATLKARISVSGLDIGRSGLELRAMTPLVAGEALIGALELGSSPWEALQSASQASDHADRVVLGDPIFRTRPKQRRLIALDPDNKPPSAGVPSTRGKIPSGLLPVLRTRS